MTLLTPTSKATAEGYGCRRLRHVAIGAREALDRLRAALDAGELDPLLERFHVDLMSAFGSANQAPEPAISDPADLDIGVRFDGPVMLLEVINLLVDVTGYDNIDVAVVTGDHPVLDADAMCGLPLYERVSGDFAEAQMAAIGHKWDTARFRELDRKLLAQ